MVPLIRIGCVADSGDLAPAECDGDLSRDQVRVRLCRHQPGQDRLSLVEDADANAPGEVSDGGVRQRVERVPARSGRAAVDGERDQVRNAELAVDDRMYC